MDYSSLSYYFKYEFLMLPGDSFCSFTHLATYQIINKKPSEVLTDE